MTQRRDDVVLVVRVQVAICRNLFFYVLVSIVMARVEVLGKPRVKEWLILFFRMGRFFGFGSGGRAQRFERFASNFSERGVDKPETLTSLAVSLKESEAVVF